MTRRTAVQMQSEIYNNPILVIRRRTVRCPLPSTTQGFFPFLAILSATVDALHTGRTFALHGIGRYAAKQQRGTRNCALAALCRESRNGAIHRRRRQILHESGKHGFSLPDFKLVLSKSPCKTGSFAKWLQLYLKNRLDNIHRKQISILAVRGRDCLPPFLIGRMDLALE